MTDVFAHDSPGSLDGVGAGDHDAPYRFDRRPRASAPYPFSTRQFARLLVLRGRVRESLGRADHAEAQERPRSHPSPTPLTSWA